VSVELINGRSAEVLLVEDSENDMELTRLAFEQAKVLLNMHRVENGEQCGFFTQARQVCQCADTGPYPAGFEPSGDGWP
jgi:hypothetical protein